MITKEEIKEVIANYLNTIEDEDDRDEVERSPDELAYSLENEQLPLTFKQVDNYGGEGKGEDRWVVHEVTNSEGESVHIKHDGYYTSYEGSTFDDGILGFDMVEPYQVSVTKYRKVK